MSLLLGVEPDDDMVDRSGEETKRPPVMTVRNAQNKMHNAKEKPTKDKNISKNLRLLLEKLNIKNNKLFNNISNIILNKFDFNKLANETKNNVLNSNIKNKLSHMKMLKIIKDITQNKKLQEIKKQFSHLKVNNDNNVDNDKNYLFENSELLTNISQIFLKYIFTKFLTGNDNQLIIDLAKSFNLINPDYLLENKYMKGVNGENDITSILALILHLIIKSKFSNVDYLSTLEECDILEILTLAQKIYELFTTNDEKGIFSDIDEAISGIKNEWLFKNNQKTMNDENFKVILDESKVIINNYNDNGCILNLELKDTIGILPCGSYVDQCYYVGVKIENLISSPDMHNLPSKPCLAQTIYVKIDDIEKLQRILMKPACVNNHFDVKHSQDEDCRQIAIDKIDGIENLGKLEPPLYLKDIKPLPIWSILEDTKSCICFVENTLIEVDDPNFVGLEPGLEIPKLHIPIEDLDETYTIDGEKIEFITQYTAEFPYLVGIKKDAVKVGIPEKYTLLEGWQKIEQSIIRDTPDGNVEEVIFKNCKSLVNGKTIFKSNNLCKLYCLSFNTSDKELIVNGMKVHLNKPKKYHIIDSVNNNCLC